MEGHLVHHFVFVDKSLLVLLIDRIVRMAFPAIKGLDALFVHRPIAVGEYLQMGLFSPLGIGQGQNAFHKDDLLALVLVAHRDRRSVWMSSVALKIYSLAIQDR